MAGSWRREIPGFVAYAVSAVVVAGVGYAVSEFLYTRYGTTWFTADVRLGVALGIVFLVAFLLSRAVRAVIRASLPNPADSGRAASVRLVSDLLIGAVLLLVLFAVLGASIESLFFGSAFIGIVLGLAGQIVLANLFAGLLLAFVHPYAPGDRIGVNPAAYSFFGSTYAHEAGPAGYVGTVVELTLLYTVVRMDDGRVAQVPNSAIVQAVLVNHSRASSHALRVRLTLPNSMPVSELEAAVDEYVRTRATSPPGSPAARVLVADVGGTTWDGVVELWVHELRDDDVRSELLRRIKSRLPAPPPPAPAAPAAARPASKP